MNEHGLTATEVLVSPAAPHCCNSEIQQTVVRSEGPFHLLCNRAITPFLKLICSILLTND